MLAIIHTRISKQRQLLKEEINSWEEFYSTNGELPTKQDMTDNLAMKQALKRLQCGDPSPRKICKRVGFIVCLLASHLLEFMILWTRCHKNIEGNQGSTV